MKFTWIFILLLCLSGLVKAQQATPGYVIVIGIDGLAAHGIRQATTPVFDSLMRVGSFTLEARSETPTVSSPNWGSILMGSSPQEHSILSNSWQRHHITDSIFCAQKKGETMPTIFKVLRQEFPEADLACFHDWDDFGRLVEQGVPSMIAATKGEDRTLAEAMRYVRYNKPLFTFIHLDHVDHAGHEHGWETSAYLEAVQKADRMVGEFCAMLQAEGMAGEAVLLIVSDHGGKGKKHGGQSEEELNIPVLISGKGIAAGKALPKGVRNADIAPQVAHLLKAKLPSCWTGKAFVK